MPGNRPRPPIRWLGLGRCALAHSLPCLAHESCHRLRKMPQYRCPFVEVHFALFGESIHPPRGSAITRLPLGSDVAIRFQLAQRAVKCAPLDLCIRQSMFFEIRGEVVPIGKSLLLEQEQNNRLYEAIEISHSAAARIILAMMRTDSLGHWLPPSIAAWALYRIKLSHPEKSCEEPIFIDLECLFTPAQNQLSYTLRRRAG